MAYTAEFDLLCYPGTTVLRNLLDIEDPELLDEVELALFLTRAEEPFPLGGFDVRHYLSLHRHLFQDVYSWAGEVRTIRINEQKLDRDRVMLAMIASFSGDEAPLTSLIYDLIA